MQFDGTRGIGGDLVMIINVILISILSLHYTLNVVT